MKRKTDPFLNADPAYHDPETAAAVILPVPYEGGVSWGKGAAQGPESVIEASRELETYDETLGFETCRMGIATLPPPGDLSSAAAMIDSVAESMSPHLKAGRFPVLLGGDHSVSIGFFKALSEAYGRLSVIQLDAHADLRDAYMESPLSHACVMARIREQTEDTLQIGIRSMSLEEAQKIAGEGLEVCTMDRYRASTFDLAEAVERLPDPVFLTLDVDVLDWSVVRSTGTPEPGGFSWTEALELLRAIFFKRNIAAFDVVELAHDPADRNSAFAAAKLIYKMLGFKLASRVSKGLITWPDRPQGSILNP